MDVHDRHADGKILLTRDQLVADKSATILIVGDAGIGKHELGKAIIAHKKQFTINIRTATGLPSDESTKRPRIDLVVFIIDLCNRHSLLVVEKSLNHVETSFFIGKVCFVACSVSKQTHRAIDIERIIQLADNYDSPYLVINMEDEESKSHSAEMIVNQLEIAAGFKPNLCSLLVDTTRMPYQSDKL